MGCTVINEKCNFLAFVYKLIVKLSDPIFKNRGTHPAFVLDLVSTRQFLTFLKHLGFFDLPMTNVGSLSPLMFVGASPVTLIVLCLPPVHLSSFRLRGFFGKAL